MEAIFTIVVVFLYLCGIFAAEMIPLLTMITAVGAIITAFLYHRRGKNTYEGVFKGAAYGLAASALVVASTVVYVISQL